MAETFSTADVEYLKRHHTNKSVEELAQRFDTDASTVHAKLRELGLVSEEQVRPVLSDPSLGAFEKGLQALYKGKYEAAAKQLREVVESSDQTELQDRARQHLAICEARLKEASGEADDPYLSAVILKNDGDLDGALEAAKSAGKAGDDRVEYLEASIHALEGRLAEARKALDAAIRTDPKNRVYAYHDPDFTALRESPEHAGKLFEVS
jgi:tetratricopeptide (TPR) repeat protein